MTAWADSISKKHNSVCLACCNRGIGDRRWILRRDDPPSSCRLAVEEESTQTVMARCGITTRTKVCKARPATRLSRTLQLLRLEDHQTHPFPLQRFSLGAVLAARIARGRSAPSCATVAERGYRAFLTFFLNQVSIASSTSAGVLIQSTLCQCSPAQEESCSVASHVCWPCVSRVCPLMRQCNRRSPSITRISPSSARNCL